MVRKSKKSKEAKFFCESCGSEVPRNSKVCPTCGKFFASVRCPQCGRTGTNDDFKNGCPTCGYALNPDLMGASGSFQPGLSSNINYKNSTTATAFRNALYSKNKSKSGYVESSLPIWVYISTVVVLIVLIALLYSCLR
ncbi:MAG: zinc ribbon domain-containing protein [Treponema sp.]|nr:zinc ribbon domain-containing protein [Treponema sp.]